MSVCEVTFETREGSNLHAFLWRSEGQQDLGLEMLEAVKRDPKHTALPIVMLTTEGQHELVQRAKAAGAKGWIVKPFKPDLLLAAIRKLTTT